MRTGLLVSSSVKSAGELQTKRPAQGKNTRDEWNSGCDRLKACDKLVSFDRNAVKELSDLPGMTTWSYNVHISWVTRTI